MRKAIASLWYAAFGVATLIHILTFFGVDGVGLAPPLWGLHAVSMIGAASTLVSGNFSLAWRGRSSVLDMLDGPPLDPDKSANDDEIFRRMRPNRLKVATMCLGGYAVVNMFVCLALLHDGKAQHNRAYPLESQDHVIPSVSEAPRTTTAVLQTRAFSGHWMLVLFAVGSVWRASARPRAPK